MVSEVTRSFSFVSGAKPSYVAFSCVWHCRMSVSGGVSSRVPPGPPSALPSSALHAPRRVWIFFDFELFRRASRLSGVRLESAWSSFFLRAEARGDAWEPAPGRARARAALELHLLRRDCPSRQRAPGHSVSVFDFAHGDPDTLIDCRGSGTLDRHFRGPKTSLFVDFAVFRDGSGLSGVELQSCWSRFWCLAEADGCISEGDSPAVVFDVAL